MDTIRKNPDIATVLVIGPNGNIGRWLIPKLLDLGYKVRALEHQSEVPAREGQEVVKGHTLDADSLKHAMDGADAVCYMIKAGASCPGENVRERWFNCCMRGSVNVLEAAKEAGLKRIVMGGTDNVFGHFTMPHAGPIDENHTKRFADGYYGLFKILEEELARQYHIGFGLPITTASFAMLRTETWGGQFNDCLDREKQQVLRRLDRDGKPFIRHDTDIEDAVQGVLLVLEKPEAIGENFLFAAAAPYSSTVVTELLAKKYGWPIVDFPTDWYSWTIDISKAKNVLGYRPQHDVFRWITEK